MNLKTQTFFSPTWTAHSTTRAQAGKKILRFRGYFGGHDGALGIRMLPTLYPFFIELIQVAGDVVCEKVVVIQRGKVFGNITALSVTVGPQVWIGSVITCVCPVVAATCNVNSSLVKRQCFCACLFSPCCALHTNVLRFGISSRHFLGES